MVESTATALIVPPPSLVTYSLAGMAQFLAARNLARRHGPELFEPGPVRIIAAGIIAGRPAQMPTSDPLLLARANAIRAEVAHALRYGLPRDEGHAVHLIGCLIADAHLPLLTDTLRWAASQVALKVNLAWIRRQIIRIFDLAEGGNVPLSSELLADPEKGGFVS